MSLIAELQRGRIFRALVGYGIVSFAVLQVIEPIMHGLRWPEAVLGYVVVALALGFPVVVALAWIFDVGTGPAPAVGRARLALVLAGIGVAGAAPGMAWYFLLRRPAPVADRSIAVLPFASLSAAADTAYFADGFHEELLRQLARMGDLQVISRTSVLQYKEGARNLKEIGQALGVSSIIEGSVQRVGNRVRVEAKLIDARTDRQLWAELYDRDLTDVFGIQSAVALEIASALHARLSPELKQQLERKPTQNPQAYDAYLRALQYDSRPDMRTSDLDLTEKFYRQAIALDPSFALARARLAIALLSQSWWVGNTPRTVVDEARHEAEEALRLEPDLPHSHLALGYYFYWGRREYEPALREFELARAGAPSEAIPAIAYVQRRQGRFDESIRNLQETVRLDPGSGANWVALGQALVMVRRYPEAQSAFDRALLISPGSDFVLSQDAMLYEQWRGDAAPARKLLREIPGRLDPEGRFNSLGSVAILMQHNPAEALSLLESQPADAFSSGLAIYPKTFLQATAHEALGDLARARREYAAILPRLEVEARAHPELALQQGVLALAYAGLQREAEARRAAALGVEAWPVSKDAMVGSWPLIDQALVLARFGDADGAIGIIERMLARPSLLSAGLLRVDPRWAPLHGDARFRKLAELDGAEALKIQAPASR